MSDCILLKNKNTVFLGGFVIVLLYFLPYIIMGENAAIRVFDNLDGEIIYKILVSRDGFWLNYNSVIPEIMNGLPRFCITSGFNFTTLMYVLFPPFMAYMANDFLMRLIGFIGMYLLLSRYFLPTDKNRPAVFLICCGYVFINYFTIYGLTDLGQPLLLYAFLNILNGRQKVIDYMCVFAFPLFVSFVLSGFFAGVALGVLWLVFCIRRKQFLSTGFYVLIGYAICSVVVEYNMIIPIIQNFHSHREEMVMSKPAEGLLLFILFQLWETYVHPGQFYLLPIWLLVITALLSSKENRKKMSYVLLIFMSVFLVIMLFSYYSPMIKGFRLSRFYHLLPLCWVMLAACAVSLLYMKGKRFVWIVYIVLGGQIAFFAFRHVNYTTGNDLRNMIGLKASYNYPSYKSFYSEHLFSEVSDYIGKDKAFYRILNIGILPAVSQYNGFFTLDSYQNNYPLAYKHQFRKIIANELEKSQDAKGIFDDFGNWCYVFPAEVNPITIIEGKYAKGGVLNNLELDPEAMRALNCKYVFSSAEIKNPEKSGLIFRKQFTDQISHWDVWLYELL